MTNQKLVEWAKQKLDEGMEEEKIRKALNKSGRDPGILDEAKKQRGQNKKPERPQQNQNKRAKKPGSDKNISGTKRSVENKKTFDSPGDKLPEIQAKTAFSKLFTGLRSNIRVLGLLLVCLSVVSGGWVLASSGILASLMPADENMQNSSEVASPEPASGYEEPTVILNEGVAKPSRATLSSSEELRFVNNVSYALKLSFESSDKDLRLEPGATETKSFDSLVYYKASPVDAADKPTISGSVLP